MNLETVLDWHHVSSLNVRACVRARGVYVFDCTSACACVGICVFMFVS